MRSRKMLAIMVLGLLVSLAVVGKAAPMGTAWTYQGRLMDTNEPGDGLYDFQFKLYDANVAGTQQGSTIDVNDIDVIDGYFTVALDFGSDIFNGDARWLDIGVRPWDSTQNYTSLSLRQKISPTPYSVQTRGIFVNDSGNVGIGTKNPQHKLHVVRNSGATIHGYTRTGIGVEGFSDGSGIGVYGYSDIEDGHAGYFSGVTYFSHRIGIGTENPTRDLHIYRDSGPAQIGVVTADTSTKAQIIFGDSGGNKWTISSDNTDDNKLHFRSGHASGTPRVTFQQDGNVGIGTTSPTVKLDVVGTNTEAVISATNNEAFYADSSGVYGYSNGGRGVSGESSDGYGVYGYSNFIGVYGYSIHSYGVSGGSTYKAGVHGRSSGGHGVFGSSEHGYGVYGISDSNYAGYFDGDVYVEDNCSAKSFTDRTPYPPNLATAYQAVISMERLPDGQYDENNKEIQLDHSMLSDFVRSKDGNRDLSATVSCHNEVLKDLVGKQKELVKAHTYIEQLRKQNELLEARLVKLEKMITKKPL